MDFMMVWSIEFKSVRNNFQSTLRKDLNKIKSSRNLLIFADKTTNLYEKKNIYMYTYIYIKKCQLQMCDFKYVWIKKHIDKASEKKRNICGFDKFVCFFIYIYIYMVFTSEGLFEVAIESWPEWDLNPRLLNSVQTL